MSCRAHVLLHGTMQRPCGFTLINRRLVAGLRDLGYRVSVLPNDGEPSEALPSEQPDVYLFHGDPYDLESAPGRVNVFFLQWEYRRITRVWVEQLNRRFDLVVVASAFAKSVCETSGVKVPVRVCRGGVDPAEFHPGVAPVELPAARGFRFIYLGGAHERRGTDVLLRAYAETFSADDDVSLILKGFHYEHRRSWVEQMIERAGLRRPGAPHLVYLHETTGSVGGYFAAADVGVFPLRAECLGLPALECLATGRPVIATTGTGLDEFCNPRNTRFIRAEERVRQGKWLLEPDRQHLGQLLREAFEQGPLPAEERDRISRTVADFDWEQSTKQLAGALEEALARRRDAGQAARAPARSEKPAPRRGSPLARHLSRALAPGAAPAVVAEAGRGLQVFWRAQGEAAQRKILLGGSGPFDCLLEIANQERARCGLAAARPAAIERWSRAREVEAADLLLVPGRAAAERFLRAGLEPSKVRVVPPGFDTPRPPQRRQGPVRFLFAAREPYRAGLRVLFEAWDAARLANARLLCLTDPALLRSPLLLRYLVRNPNIELRHPYRFGSLEALMGEVDCVVLPGFLQGYPEAATAALSRGRALITSSASGLGDVLSPTSAELVEGGSVEALAGALVRYAEDRAALTRLGQAGQEVAARYSWRAFERSCASLLEADA